MNVIKKIGIWTTMLAIALNWIFMPTAAHATQAGGKRAAVLMPFVNGGKTGIDSPATHEVHGGASFGFAWDMHGGASTGVYPRVNSNDGTVTMKIIFIYTSSNGAGQGVDVEVKVDGVYVGKLRYSHLVNLGVSNGQTGITEATRLGDTAPNQTFGACVGFVCSDSWDVHGVAGVHTHMEFSKSCYGPQGISQDVGPNSPIALLSQNYGDANNSYCDSAELASVASAFAPVVITRPNGETDVIVVTATNKLVYYFSDGNTWNHLDVTGDGGAYSAPSVILRSNGEIGIAVVAPGNNIDYYSRTPSAQNWSRSTFANGAAFGNPSMLLRANGELNVVVRGPGDILDYYFSATGSSWGRTTIAGNGGAKGDPTIAQRPNGEVNIIVPGPENRLDYYFYTSTWNLYTVDALAGTAMLKPTIIQRPGGEMDIVTVTNEHRLNFYYNPAGWNSFGVVQVPGSQAYSAPAASLRPNGEVNIAVMGPNQKMEFYFNAQSSQTWGHIPIAIDNTVKSGPSMVQRASGETDVVVTNTAYQTDYYMNNPGQTNWGRLTLP